MPIVFLDAVNETLKRVRVIQGDAGELATSTVTSTATGAVATDAFTDSGRQTQIDLAIQLWQEATHEVYRLGMFASGIASATVVLSDSVREYAMPGDFERFAGRDDDSKVLRGVTNGLVLRQYRGGYARMLADQPVASDYRGQPHAWARSPVTGNLRFDREPTSDEAGETYNFLYEKRLTLTSTMATESLPYSDTVAAALVPVVAEGWNRIMAKEFDSALFQVSLARALDFVSADQPRLRYGKRRNF